MTAATERRDGSHHGQRYAVHTQFVQGKCAARGKHQRTVSTCTFYANSINLDQVILFFSTILDLAISNRRVFSATNGRRQNRPGVVSDW